MKPTAEYIRSLLHYDPLSGLFRWLVTRNRQLKVGDLAGSYNAGGYLVIMVDGKNHGAHRIAWLYMTGKWPADQIDHISGVRTDNRWSNLREATQQQNLLNKKIRNDNNTGFKGVRFNKRTGKWWATIGLDGRSYHLGTFDKPEEASAWYEGAAAILFGNFKRTTTITIKIEEE